VKDFPNGSPKKITDLEAVWQMFSGHLTEKNYLLLLKSNSINRLQIKSNLPNANVRIYESLPIRHWTNGLTNLTAICSLFLQKAAGNRFDAR